MASADLSGVVRVGRADGSEPHLLLGLKSSLWGVHFLPGDEQVVSVDGTGVVRIWETPEGTPFHTLPFEELLACLRALTNLRAVQSATAPGGYELRAEPFRGWKVAPTW